MLLCGEFPPRFSLTPRQVVAYRSCVGYFQKLLGFICTSRGLPVSCCSVRQLESSPRDWWPPITVTLLACACASAGCLARISLCVRDEISQVFDNYDTNKSGFLEKPQLASVPVAEKIYIVYSQEDSPSPQLASVHAPPASWFLRPFDAPLILASLTHIKPLLRPVVSPPLSEAGACLNPPPAHAVLAAPGPPLLLREHRFSRI